ncbi:MAG: AsmA family protein, partial [Terriglobia bacterium]
MSLVHKLLLALAALVALLLGGLAVFLYTFDANQYRGTILSQLSRALKRPVEAAELELQLLPLRLRFNELRIREAPGFAGEEFIRARAVQVDINLWSLLRGQPEVQALELDQPTIHLRQDRTGRWNLSTLASKQRTEPGETGAHPAPAASAPVRNWLLRDGTIVIDRAGKPPLRLSSVELAVTDLSTVRSFPFRLAVGFPSQSSVSATGRLGPLNLEALPQTPLEVELTLENFRPAALLSFVAVPPELARLGVLDGMVAVDSGAKGTSLRGALTLLGALAEENVDMQLDLAFPPGWGQVNFSDTAIEYRGARVTGRGRVELSSSHPTGFDLALTTEDAALNALRSLPSRLGWTLPETIPPASGLLTAHLSLKGTPEQWLLSGRARLRNLAIPVEGLPQPVRVESLELTLEPKRIRAAPFQVTPGPGFSVTVAGAVEDYRGQARLAARVTGEAVPLAPLVALAARLGQKPLAEGWKLGGRVSPALDFSGPLKEPTELRYEGTLAFRDFSLTTPQLPEPIRAGAFQLALSPTQISADPFTAQIGDRLRARLNFRLDDYRNRPKLNARLATEGADLAALLALARTLGHDPLPGGRARGRITTTIDINGSLAEHAPPLALQGQARLQGASIQPAALAEPLGIEQASITFRPNRLELRDLRVAVSGSKAQGSLRVDNFEAPRVAFDLRGDSLDIDALQQLFGAGPGAKVAAWNLSDLSSELFFPVVQADEKQPQWFAQLTGRGRLAFDRLQHGTLTLEPFIAPVTIAQRVVTCDPIEFGLNGGGGRGRLVVDLRGREPVIQFDGLLRNVDANKLLSENSASKNRLFGRLGGTLALRFAGTERPQIIRSAQGKGQLTLVRGRLAQLNLSRELVTVGQVTGLRFNQQDTPLEDIVT